MLDEQQIRLNAILAARERQLSAALGECCNLAGEIAVLRARLDGANKQIAALTERAMDKADRLFEAIEQHEEVEQDVG